MILSNARDSLVGELEKTHKTHCTASRVGGMVDIGRRIDALERNRESGVAISFLEKRESAAFSESCAPGCGLALTIVAGTRNGTCGERTERNAGNTVRNDGSTIRRGSGNGIFCPLHPMLPLLER